MTETTFWEDESPLIQLIIGKEWQELKRICPVRSFRARYPYLVLRTPESRELYEFAQTKLDETYRRLALTHFDEIIHTLQRRFFKVSEMPEENKILIEIGAHLPNFGDEALPFPWIFFKMMYDPEMMNGENKKRLIALETKFLDVFEEKGYEFDSQTGMGCITTHQAITKISTLEELDVLFSNLRKVYDSLGEEK